MSPGDEAPPAPAPFVVDASVAIKLFLDEPLKPQARALFERAVAGPSARLLAPDLFFVECANVLWKWVWRFGYAVDQARDDLADVTLALNGLLMRSSPRLQSTTRRAATQAITMAAESCLRRPGVRYS